ncbi:MAG: zinc-binding dehydrogenase [Myxococcales bacterium]|nr:zinc-binding dehydrogenase [Myxococcales bacterium]
MRAALLEAQGRPLRICDDIEIEAPRSGQVRVRVAHCGICHSDLGLIDGTFPSPLPIVLGHEAAGVVDGVGPGVEGLAAGDPVVLTPCPPCGACYWCVRGEASLCVDSSGIQTSAFPDGHTGLSRDGQTVYRGLNVAAFAEYAVLPATGAVRIPADVPLDVACVIGCAVQTGVGAVLNTAGVEEGATVLVMGLGGVGLAIVQGARIAGAARILASDPIAERREVAKRFGATDLLDPTDDDVVARARALTGVGVDYAFESAGRASLVEAGLAAVRSGGTVVCVGAPALGEAITLAPAALFVVTGKKLLGCVLGGCHSLREVPRLIALWRAGRLDLNGLITTRRPLAEINEALDDLAAGRGIRTVLSV